MSKEEIDFFLRHLVSIVQIKRFADSFDQLCFQMERLWFSVLQRKAGEAAWWFHESANKTLAIDAFDEAYRDLTQSLEHGMVKHSKVRELLTLSHSVRDCYKRLQGEDGSGSSGDQGTDYYLTIGNGEDQALALSRFILSIFSDIQKQITQ